MVDPITAFGAIAAGVKTGKSIMNMTKELSNFMDSCDNAKKSHEKKKSSMFASANEEAMDTFMKRQQAIDAEEQLRDLIIGTRGYSAYQDLLKLRREILAERKEMERELAADRIRKKENSEAALIIVILVMFVAGFAVLVLMYLEIVDPSKW
tara:strand:- start:208 stop:663 length:456 start_codon:yes stop_codon:yes gene_type:complete